MSMLLFPLVYSTISVGGKAQKVSCVVHAYYFKTQRH